MKILFVDDYRETAESLAELVNLLGHETKMAQSSAEAAAKALEWGPDVIFIDILLGTEDGRELCRKLRRVHALARCKFVALSGMSPLDIECEPGLFDATLAKPIDFESLENVIKRTSSAAH